jgi:hypothetical protein
VHPDGLTPREEPDSGYKCYLTPLPRETTSNLCRRFTDAVGQQTKTLEIDEFVRFPVANVLKAVRRGGQTIDDWDNKPKQIRDRTWKVNVNDGKHLQTITHPCILRSFFANALKRWQVLTQMVNKGLLK